MELKDSKLIQLLKTFNEADIKRLENYINSPFFNKSKQITQVFDLLIESYPHFNNLTKEKIFNAVYKNESYKDKKVRDLLFRLLKLVEDFLAQAEFSEKDILQKLFVMQQLSKRNLEKHFIGTLNEAEQKLNKQEIASTDYFFNKYSVLKEKRNYLEFLKTLGKRSKFFDEITEEIDLFVVYSIFKILKYGLTLQTHEKISRRKHDFKMLEDILEYLKKNPLDNFPVIMIYYYIIILNRDQGDDTYYFKAIKLFNDNFDFLEFDDRRTLMIVLFNYTQAQAIKGKAVFKKENYRILKESIEKGLYPMDGNYFAENAYITIVGTALQEKDYQWAEAFMDKYSELLNPQQKVNAHNYCKSILNYRLGKYGDALRGLARVSIDDFYYQLRVKNHLMKIYYEMGDYESVERTIGSFRHFLSTTKYIPEYIRVRFVNYVNFLSRIVNALLSENLNNIIDIKREIIEIKQETLENKIWLLEQIDKLKI